MAQFLFHVGRWSYLHKWVVILVWLLALLGVTGSALSFQKGFNDIFAINNVPSTQATEILMDKFPGTDNPAASADVNMVWQAPEGHRLDEPAYMEAMDRTTQTIKDTVPQLGSTLRWGNPVTVNHAQTDAIVDQLTNQGLPKATATKDAYTQRVLSDDATIGTSTFSFDVALPAEVTDADRAAVEAAAQISRDAGLRVEIGGPGFGDPIEIEPISEIVGVVVALIILAITFMSLLAAGLPLISALVGVGIGAFLTVGATAFVPLNSMTPTLGLMIGLAVGIDYALFIMARYRDELALGRSRPDAIGLACGTAGSAVVFAGVTVIVALVGLRLVNIPFLSAMGYFAAAFVLVAVLLSLTFLPALLGLLGRRVFKSEASCTPRESVREDGRATGPQVHGTKENLGTRWVKLVHRFPGVALAVVMAVLALLTLPALNLQLSLPNDTTSSVTSTQRQAADLLAEGFGEGRNAPMLVLVDAEHARADATVLAPYIGGADARPEADAAADAPASPQQAAFIYAMDQLQNNPEVEHAQLVGQSEDGTTAQLVVTPVHGPREESTVQLIHALREQQADIERETGVTMGITGLIPIQQDVTDTLKKAMPIYLALVVGLALVLLMMVFRSLLVPLMAAGGFLLSVGAAFGVTVLVWQEGLWDLWDSPGPLISFMPIFLIGVTFGLAMDYQVFIVSRMRERYIQESQRLAQDPDYTYSATEDSVIHGFGLGARVVTVAALIMIAVFVSFIFQPLPFIQIFGFALGAGVLFDAFLIRMTAIPALMLLAGRATWYMPKWLDKVLPTLDVEGSSLEKAFSSGKITRHEGAARD
ncbi:MMPL family transporter [Corynebacterium sp. zg254]|uniref:MMPL family transporter n=1 Tax=Corynebacterium sp. zg254 TaxID=2656645 RepID=UPI002151B3C0|nr:MMPL family transporter [Corynebacterium sp. zg254]MCR5914987.1 MMPL family transporter [Corynebacterium sp. zg254]